MKLTTLDVFNSNALKYETKFMGLQHYHATYDALLDHLKPNASVLEIGCGPGNISRYLLDKRPSLKILATDFSPNMIELASKNLPEAKTAILDAKEISGLSMKFDAIACGFIAPYLAKDELKKLISDCAGILSGKGAFYLSCIQGAYEKSRSMASSDGKVSAFVHYYEAADVVELLCKHGFSEVEKFDIAYESDTHLVFIARVK